MKLRAIPLLVLLAGCNDTPTVPAGGAFFRLSLVNGVALPANIAGSTWTNGDLLLRGDKTFRLGLNSATGIPLDGTYTLSGNAVEFRANGSTREGEYFGNRAAYYVSTIFGQVQYVFDRATPVPTSTIDGRFALTAVEGAVQMPDGSFVLDTVDASGRVVFRWLFDTLTFTDGMFVRRREATLDSTLNPVAAQSVNVTEYGSLSVVAGLVTYTPYTFGRAPLTLTLGSPGFTRADSSRTFTYSAIP